MGQRPIVKTAESRRDSPARKSNSSAKNVLLRQDSGLGQKLSYDIQGKWDGRGTGETCRQGGSIRRGVERRVGGVWVCHSMTVLSCRLLLGRMETSSTGKMS